MQPQRPNYGYGGPVEPSQPEETFEHGAPSYQPRAPSSSPASGTPASTPGTSVSPLPHATSSSTPNPRTASSGLGGSNRNQPATTPAASGRVSKQVSGKKAATHRGSGFGQAELISFLEILENKLPLCRVEWESVLTEHEKRFIQNERTVDGLRRKFANLHRKKIPTGDPMMPEDVRRAKRIRYKMTERADIGVGDAASVEDFLPAENSAVPDDPLQSDEETPDVCASGYVAPPVTSPPVATPVVSSSLYSAEEDVLNPRPSELESPSPRPLVHRRASGRERRDAQRDESDDLMSLLKAQIVQDGIRRDEEFQRREQDRREEAQRREEDRKEKEEERREERKRREEDARRHDRMMQIMMMMAFKGNVNDMPDLS